MTDLAKLAAGLSGPMRECVQTGTKLGCVSRNARTRRAMISRGLAVSADGTEWDRCLDWTDLGLRLRAHLLKDQTP